MPGSMRDCYHNFVAAQERGRRRLNIDTSWWLAGGDRRGLAALNAGDTHLPVFPTQATTISLSQQGFVSAIGGGSNDSITALAAGQTLTRGLGLDLLIGAGASGDAFNDSAAGLNGDTITNFIGTDVIDLTDLAPGAGFSLTYASGAASGVLTVSEGGITTEITLTGSFTQGEFNTTSDGHGGILI